MDEIARTALARGLAGLLWIAPAVGCKSKSAADDAAPVTAEDAARASDAAPAADAPPPPPDAAPADASTTFTQLTVGISADGELSLDGEPISRDKLREAFADAAGRDAQLLVRPAKGAQHGQVVDVIDLAKEVGITQIGVVRN